MSIFLKYDRSASPGICPLCNSADIRLINKSTDSLAHINVNKCNRCLGRFIDYYELIYTSATNYVNAWCNSGALSEHGTQRRN